MAEGTQVYNDMLAELQKQGVQPSGANLSAMLSAQLQQQPQQQPIAEPVAEPTAAPQRHQQVATRQRVPPTVTSSTGTQPERRGDILDFGAPSGAQPVSSSLGLAEIVGAALSALGLGGLGYAATRSGNGNTASKPPPLPSMQGDMSVKNPLMGGDASPVASMSDATTRQEYKGNPRPAVPMSSPQATADAVSGTKLSNIDFAASGISDPNGVRIPTPPNQVLPDAVSMGPRAELQRVITQAGLTVEQLPPEIKSMVMSDEAARAVADRPGMMDNVKTAIMNLGKQVKPSVPNATISPSVIEELARVLGRVRR